MSYSEWYDFFYQGYLSIGVDSGLASAMSYLMAALAWI
jgi:hypothetical protein